MAFLLRHPFLNIAPWLLALLCTPYSFSQNVPSERASVWVRAEAITGEGAIFHPGRKSLLWVDIEGKRLYETCVSHPAILRQWQFDEMVSTVVPESDTSVLVALEGSLVRVDLLHDRREELTKLKTDNGTLRCNDGKCDPAGRLWIGTMAFRGTPGAGSLYCYEAGRLRRKIRHVTISNGLVWSADRTLLYYIDTPTRTVARFRYNDRSGAIRYTGIAIRIPDSLGAPDGMTADAAGNLWIAHWGGFGVYCWNPHTGKLLRKITVPAPNVTSCAFGGERLDTLFITTAGGQPDSQTRKDYPLGGSLFFCKPGVNGVAPSFFLKKIKNSSKSQE